MPHIGPYSLHTIETGRFGLDGGAMFGIVPKPLWSDRIAPDAQNRIPLHMRCLLLKGADRVILIDAGIGDVFEGTKYQDIYAVDHSDAHLHASLQACGVAPPDVTDVLLTHLHFDHCGGVTQQTPEGRSLTFPNATNHVQRRHWAWATDPTPKDQGSFRRETFAPLKAQGRLNLVEGGGPLLPHIRVALVDGHTEAQQIVMVHDETTTLVYVADLLPTLHHVRPAWTMAYDVRPLQTIDEKATFLERAANAEWKLFFEHDPKVAVGDPERTDRGIEIVRGRSLDDL